MKFLRRFIRDAEEGVVLSVSVVIVSLLAASAVVALSQNLKPEVEGATLTGGAAVVDDAAASGGKYVVFNPQVQQQNTTQKPAAQGTAGGPVSSGSGGSNTGGSNNNGTGQTSTLSGWPDDYNTGYPHGLPGDTRAPVTLTAYSGPCTITVANTVIDSKDITCRINIRANNVTIKNSRIRVSNESAVNINDEYHAIIMDTELDGQRGDNSAGGISLIGDGSYTLLRVNAHSSGDIARANWGNVQIIDSWLHDPYCLQASCHNDIIQTTDGDCSSVNATYPYCILIRHNRLENPHTQTSNILLKADQGSIHDVMVENNLFNGGGYTFYWYDANYQISNGTVRNNRFKRAAGGGYWPNGGYYGPVASNVSDSGRWPVWSNNVWDDDGSPIAF